MSVCIFFWNRMRNIKKFILSFSWKWNMNMLAALSWSKNASVVTVIEIWLELTTSAHATSTISGELATRQKNWVNDILVKRTAVSNRNKGKFYQNEKVANRPIFSLEVGLLGNTLLGGVNAKGCSLSSLLWEGVPMYSWSKRNLFHGNVWTVIRVVREHVVRYISCFSVLSSQLPSLPSSSPPPSSS